MSGAAAVGVVLGVLAITVAPLWITRRMNRRARLYFQLRCGCVALLIIGAAVSGSSPGVGGAMILIGFLGYAAVFLARQQFGLGRPSTSSSA